jgi:hypothetical protein
MVDVDYADQLPETERTWLAAFLEEHYKGYRLAAETQLHPLDKLRESDAARKRVLRSEDVLAFDQHRAGSVDAPMGKRARESQELAMLAASQGRVTHELRGRNYVEDSLIDHLDRTRLLTT